MLVDIAAVSALLGTINPAYKGYAIDLAACVYGGGGDRSILKHAGLLLTEIMAKGRADVQNSIQLAEFCPTLHSRTLRGVEGEDILRKVRDLGAPAMEFLTVHLKREMQAMEVWCNLRGYHIDSLTKEQLVLWQNTHGKTFY